jgi:pimeloyl-ACP methyl ester carboxylesterase
MHKPSKIIFLPGAFGNPDFWRPVSELLVHPASRKLLGWPGFGITPRVPNVEGIQDLINLVVNEIDQPSALIAQSMGGIIAVQAALKRPELVTHLVLSVTSGGVDTSDLQVEDWRPEFLAANPTIPRWFAEYRNDISSNISSVRAPVLLLWGDVDPISPVAVGKRLQGLLPKSKMYVIPGGEHDLANKLAAKIAPLIKEHLDNGSCTFGKPAMTCPT